MVHLSPELVLQKKSYDIRHASFIIAKSNKSIQSLNIFLRIAAHDCYKNIGVRLIKARSVAELEMCRVT